MTVTFPLSVSKIKTFHSNKKFHFTCCLELSFQKPEHMHMDHLKYVKLLIYVCERSMQSFGTRFQHQVCRWGYWRGRGCPLTKHPIYLVFLQAFIASYNFQMGHKKHGHCPFAQVGDAPKVLGHASISKWAVGATTERRTSWLRGYIRKWREQNLYVGI